MSWVGGKKALRDEIVSRFPLDYKRYIEVFGGGGWVLFHKNPGKDFEVFNDYNGNLVNLYRCVREHKEDLIDELEFMLNSRLQCCIVATRSLVRFNLKQTGLYLNNLKSGAAALCHHIRKTAVREIQNQNRILTAICYPVVHLKTEENNISVIVG